MRSQQARPVYLTDSCYLLVADDAGSWQSKHNAKRRFRLEPAIRDGKQLRFSGEPPVSPPSESADATLLGHLSGLGIVPFVGARIPAV